MNLADDQIPSLMAEALVPGIAIAAIRDGAVDRILCVGKRHADADAAIDEDTVFDAASLTKPVFAYVVLQLADQGHVALDAPLGTYLPRYLPGDARTSTVTLADILSHSAGLPNWRNADFPLKTYFAAGERFSYSGEGYWYAQRAVEAVTGESIEALGHRLVFEPLAMRRSSFLWSAAFADNRAYGHDAFGRPALGTKPGEANVAWTLQTTARDYARFLVAVLGAERLKPETAALWLHPRVDVKHKGIQSLGPSAEDVRTGIAWGLGWGLERDTGCFFHWGDNGPFTAFAIGSTAAHDAVVVFANGVSGLSIMPRLLAPFVPGERPSLTWLDYAAHDAPMRQLLRKTRADGVASIWTEVEGGTLKTDELRWIAQGLLAAGRADDSTRLREFLDREIS